MEDPTSINKTAITHLEDAEASIMSYMVTISNLDPNSMEEDIPDALPMMLAVLRSISRAAGVLSVGEE